MKTVYVLNGPNLNLLGLRHTPGETAGSSLADVEQRLRDRAREAQLDIVFLQTNHEGDLVDWIHEAGAAGAPVILNAGAYAHTSVALHDAISGAGATVIEVQLTTPKAGDPLRNRSYIAPVTRGAIIGFGARSYELALDALLSAEMQRSE